MVSVYREYKDTYVFLVVLLTYIDLYDFINFSLQRWRAVMTNQLNHIFSIPWLCLTLTVHLRGLLGDLKNGGCHIMQPFTIERSALIG